MFGARHAIRIETERMVLRLPRQGDFHDWSRLRLESQSFLTKWEPAWADNHLSRRAFRNRVHWAAKAARAGSSVPLFLVARDGPVMGALTLDNIRRGPAQSAMLGYWIGERFARQGFMAEAIAAIVTYAFETLELSRIEAACLAENVASRGVLEKSGFCYEGVAKSYLQINGQWRDHVLYSHLRADRPDQR